MFGFEGSEEFGPLAQLVRAPPCHGGGRRFKSVMGREISRKRETSAIRFSLPIAPFMTALSDEKRILDKCKAFVRCIAVKSLRLAVNTCNGVLAQLGEHLPYKQRVIGSSPIGPTNLDNFILFLIMGRFPSGQRGQTVNLLATPSVVRIHLCPFLINAG